MAKRFTTDQASEIRKLLREKVRASRDRQKTIRGRLRALGFDISNYRLESDGFRASDFDRLVESEQVEIVD